MEYLVLSKCISHFLLFCGDQEGIEIHLVQGVYVHNCGYEKWPGDNSKRLKPLPDLKTKRRSARDSAEAAGKQRKQGQLKRVSRL